MMSNHVNRVNRAFIACALVITLSGFASLESIFAPKADLWERWNRHDETSTTHVNHAKWSQFLQKYVETDQSGLNRVKYGQVSDEDANALKAYIAELGQVPINSLNKQEQLAYWINAYNAVTIGLVLEHYPVKSIKDIDLGGGFFSSGPWSQKLFEVDGEKLSLNEIEHRVLRPIWKDPRIHYAVNCASISCPNLQKQAFTSKNTEALLDQGARTYINGSYNISIKDGKLSLSKIYTWFQGDFGSSDAAVLEHVRKYASPETTEKLANFTSITDYTYDWGLNDTTP